jgi:hypothetical protein
MKHFAAHVPDSQTFPASQLAPEARGVHAVVDTVGSQL